MTSMPSVMAWTSPPDRADGTAAPAKLRRAHARAGRARSLTGLALALPLLTFLIAFFLLPLTGVLRESVTDPVVPETLPLTARALEKLPWNTVPPDATIATFARELATAQANDTAGALARRLNGDMSGFRRLVSRTAEAIDPARSYTVADLVALDDRWGEGATWSIIKAAGQTPSATYILAGLDLRRNAEGEIVSQPDHLSVFLPVLLRSVMISAIVTAVCAALAIPLAYFIHRLPETRARLALFFVMLPFWTSALVRITGWTVILQKDGVFNQIYTSLIPSAEPLEMMYTNVSMYLGMVHLMLPFMTVPVLSAMRQVDPRIRQAALSLGARPLRSFFEIFLPQCTAGVGSGCAIVFILTLGTYTTPVLLGGAGQQMLSYFISFYTNQMLNWNMAAALSAILLIMTLAACLLGAKFLMPAKERRQ